MPFPPHKCLTQHNNILSLSSGEEIHCSHYYYCWVFSPPFSLQNPNQWSSVLVLLRLRPKVPSKNLSFYVFCCSIHVRSYFSFCSFYVNFAFFLLNFMDFSSKMRICCFFAWILLVAKVKWDFFRLCLVWRNLHFLLSIAHSIFDVGVFNGFLLRHFS